MSALLSLITQKNINSKLLAQNKLRSSGLFICPDFRKIFQIAHRCRAAICPAYALSHILDYLLSHSLYSTILSSHIPYRILQSPCHLPLSFSTCEILSDNLLVNAFVNGHNHHCRYWERG